MTIRRALPNLRLVALLLLLALLSPLVAGLLAACRIAVLVMWAVLFASTTGGSPCVAGWCASWDSTMVVFWKPAPPTVAPCPAQYMACTSGPAAAP